MGFVARGFADMLENQLVREDANLLSDDHGAVVAVRDDRPIGFITIRNNTSWNGDIWIVMAWVDEPWRRKGVFRTMYKQVREFAEKEGARSISLGTRHGNLAMRRAVIAEGGAEDFILFRHDIV